MTDREKVAVFWDFENCSPPSTQGLGYDIANNIGRIARIFGCVTTFKAYLDISSQPSKSTALRSELQLSGVSVVDCPHSGKKDVVDKMAIVDMFAFAVDHPPPATVVLIAGDRDYAYALSTLRLRNYKVVLITPRATSCLEACASFVVDWSVALTKTRMESNADSVRRPYIDKEASLFDRLSREVSRFGDNLTGISVPPNDIKPRRSKSPDLIRPFTVNDTSTAGEFKFAQRSSEGLDQYTNGNDDLSGFVTASEMLASPRHSSMSSLSPLRRRSASIRSGAVSKPSSESLELVTECLSHPPDTCLKALDDADATTGRSDPFIPNGGEDHQSSKDEPQPSIRTGSPAVKAQPPQTTFNHPGLSSNPRLAMSSTTSSLSGVRLISGGTIVSRGDVLDKMKSEDAPTDEIERMTAPLFRQCTAEPTVDPNLATAHRSTKDGHLPVDVPTAAAKDSSPPFQANQYGSRSDNGRKIPPVSVDDDNIDVPADKDWTSCRNFLPYPKATNLSVERQSTHANSVGVPEEPMGTEGLSGVSPPTSHATFNVIPGSPAVQTPIPPASSMPTSTTTEQTNREQTRRQFLPLIRQLVADRRRGVLRPSRSDVAAALMQADKNTYKHVGVTKFKRYAALAQRAGLVVLGGVEGDSWIALHPDWLDEAEATESGFNTRTIGAGCFQPLVDILVQFHRSGVRSVLRSRVGQMLEPTAYRDAGVPGFKEYITRAIEVGIVLCGGVDGYAWICLHPDVEVLMSGM